MPLRRVYSPHYKAGDGMNGEASSANKAIVLELCPKCGARVGFLVISGYTCGVSCCNCGKGISVRRIRGGEAEQQEHIAAEWAKECRQ